jgi:putative transposase
VKMDPFIEAAEAAGHSVKRCCELFEVSRASYYQRRTAVPSARELSDAELTDRIREVHAGSNGTYGSPRVWPTSCDAGAWPAGGGGCDG